MHKVIQYSFIFLLLAIVVPAAMGDAFDQTVEQIKTLEAELEQNRETALQEIETKIAAERETNPLNAPKDQFESDADYQARLNELEGVLSKIHSDIWGVTLEDNKTRKAQVMQLYNRIFQTPLTVTIGTYDANSEYFPITVEVPLNDESQQRTGRLYIGKDDARDLFNNWDQVIKTGYLSIDPGFLRNLTRLKLEIPNLSKEFIFQALGYTQQFYQMTHVVFQLPNPTPEAPIIGISHYIYNPKQRIAYSTDFSPNGLYIATGTHNYGGPFYSYANMQFWEVEGRKKIWSKTIDGYITDFHINVAFGPNGEYLVVDAYDPDSDSYYVALLEALSGHEIARRHFPDGSFNEITDVDYGPNGHSIAIAIFDRDAYRAVTYLWQPTSEKIKGWYNYEGEGDVECVAFSPDGEFLATGSDKGIVRLWDVSTWWTNDVVSQRLQPGGKVRAVAFSPNGKYLAADGSDGSKSYITFWEVNSGKEILRKELKHASDHEVYALAFSPCGEYLAVGTKYPYGNGARSIYRIGTQEIIPTTDITHFWGIGTSGTAYDLAWSPSGNLITDGYRVWRTLLHPEIHNLDSEIVVEPIQQTTNTEKNKVVVRLTPATLESPPIGTQLSLNLDIVGAESITGYQATVTFDSTALRYVESANGDYLSSGAFFISPIVDGNTVTLAASSLAGESSGDGTLATLTFEIIAAKASTVSLSDVLLTDKDGGSSTPEIENTEITEPLTQLPADVNQDGVVNIVDLTLVASNNGKTGENVADVNDDGVVNIVDLTLVAAAFGNTAAAPIAWDRDSEIAPTRQQVQQWLREAHQRNLTDPAFQRGILVLEQLLAALTPKETALLPNYPNPFNPETWIPYQLAEPANVSISIYAVGGKRIRTLDLGHQPVGIYQNRTRAAYWDGRNELGEPVASGVYFYTLTAGDFTATRKMLIRK